MTPQLPSQVGFYLLPPEQKSKRRKHPRPLVPRHWKSQSHLDVITEASEESRNSTPNTSSTLTQLLSPTLLRKNTALPGLMFDRPTRHPSLDDLRGYGRNMSYDRESPGQRLDGLKLPPIANNNLPYDHTKCLHPQSRICENLRYNLHQLRIRNFEDTYQTIIDAVVIGPAEVEAVDVEEVLGISTDEYLRSKFKRSVPSKLDVGSRQESQDSVEEEEVPQPSHPQPNTSKRIPVPPPPPVEYPDYRFGYKGKSGGPHFEVESRGLRMRRYSMLLSRPGLRRQFDRFARYGEPRATGDFITLSQTEKWFKQAGVIDNWNVTTTDTAIYFRKISKGSKWVDYDNWRIFLEELAWRKRLNLDYLIDRLELTGKPPVTNSSYVPPPTQQPQPTGSKHHYERKLHHNRFASHDRRRNY
ncbi:uncharacterized protein LOC131883658 isoform X2 [Tigriopus californicus]|uniref:uncharacterized protein LOC131883658 isoform X2 n=1 Tax=Tigriopus californicus TaxID=6832 RepID=UPI0027DA7BED|nr:uncharacterized protein LOC131883658 isoform X2 [Tigriopus californicus]